MLERVLPPTPPTSVSPTTTTTVPPRRAPTTAAPRRKIAQTTTIVAPTAEQAPDGPANSDLPQGLVCIGDNESMSYTAHGMFDGRYQYLPSTWAHYGGYARADLAPPEVQDRRALADYNLGAAHRHREWPTSSRACGV